RDDAVVDTHAVLLDEVLGIHAGTVVPDPEELVHVWLLRWYVLGRWRFGGRCGRGGRHQRDADAVQRVGDRVAVVVGHRAPIRMILAGAGSGSGATRASLIQRWVSLDLLP